MAEPKEKLSHDKKPSQPIWILGAEHHRNIEDYYTISVVAFVKLITAPYSKDGIL